MRLDPMFPLLPPTEVAQDPERLRLWNEYWDRMTEEWNEEVTQENRDRRRAYVGN